MLELDESELALIQRQCERAHIAHPDAAMVMLLLPTRNPAADFVKLPPFARADGSLVHEQGHIVNCYEHSQGYVEIRFYGSDEARRLYEHIAMTACLAMPNKRLASSWGEYLFEVRQFRDRPVRFATDIARSVMLQENPFLASAIAIQQILTVPAVDTEILKGRSLEAIRAKFEAAAQRWPDARHCVLIGNSQLDHHGGGEYSFKTPQGRWWRCGATGVEMNEFGMLCRTAALCCEDDPRCTLMPKPEWLTGFAHDDAWMMFVYRLAWTEPADSELRASTEMVGGNRISAEVASFELTGLFSELRPNLYAACAMAIDAVLAMPKVPIEVEGTKALPTAGSEWPPGEWRTAAWYRGATSDLLLPEAMRQAGNRTLISRFRLKERDDWRYEVDSVIRNWPEHRVVIEKRLQSDKGQRGTTVRERTPADASGQMP